MFQSALLEKLKVILPGERIESPILRLLSHHFSNLPFRIEISRKIENNKTYESRVNLLFDRELEIVHGCCEKLLEELPVRIINTTNDDFLLKEYYPGITESIYAGIDIREPFQDSSVRIWHEHTNARVLPLKIKNRISTEKRLPGSIDNCGLLIGREYFFNGNDDIRVYFNYFGMNREKNLKEKISAYINGRVVHALSFCDFSFIRFKNNNDIFIYFSTSRMKRLLDFLLIMNVDFDALLYKEKFPYMIGLYYKEILSGCISNYNTYYLI